MRSTLKRIGAVVWALLIALPTLAQTHAASFDSRTFSFAGVEMGYRVARVGNGDATPVLAMYLHGGSSKGSDNEKQLVEPGVDSLYNYLEAHDMDAILLVPQCPTDKSWGGRMSGVLAALVRQYTTSGEADAGRAYIFGGSMGGTGTWSMLSAFPRLFTAAMPVAANPSGCMADSVALTPAYTVMGTADRIMAVETASDFVAQLKAKGGECVMDIEEGWTHEVTCIESYTTPRLDWVFSHTRQMTGIAAIEAPHPISTRYFSIDGCPLPAKPTCGLYIIMDIMSDGTTNTTKTFRH